MRLGDFSAHVTVEGKNLKEYEVTVNSSETQATCWIGSEVGRKFSVNWRCRSKRGPDSRGDLAVDGINCDSVVSDGTNIVPCSVMRLGMKERDLIFCDLQLSDDDALLAKSVSSHLGEITLRIIRGTVSRKPVRAMGAGSQLTNHSHANVYHEKSVKKLTTHCVGFGSERECTSRSLVGWKSAPNYASLEFIFKYRPIGILQANGIAPRPAPAIPPTFSDNPSDTQKTQSRVLDRIELLENELKRLRSQVHDEMEDQKPKRIKREHKEERPAVHGEVIDLT